MKVAFSLPDPIFDAAEALASAMNKPRSQLYAEAIAQFIELHSAANVTQRLNATYATEQQGIDTALAHAQWKTLPNETW
jgi:predicted transcriptional regulator